MPTNQEARQASVRAVTGTTRDYNGDWSALFDLSSIAAGDWNGRFLAWLNLKLSATYTSLPSAMQALAVANGAYDFSALGTFDASTSPAAPVNTAAPAITGIQTQGQTLTSSTGTWTGSPAPTYSYQWKRGASNIGAATSSTYVLQLADVAASITCVVTASNASGTPTATSNTVVPAATLAISGTPSTTGSVGGTYTFTPSTTGGHTAYTYSLSGTIGASGLSFNTSTGALTATTLGAAATYGPYTITVTDADGLPSALSAFSVVVSSAFDANMINFVPAAANMATIRAALTQVKANTGRARIIDDGDSTKCIAAIISGGDSITDARARCEPVRTAYHLTNDYSIPTNTDWVLGIFSGSPPQTIADVQAYMSNNLVYGTGWTKGSTKQVGGLGVSNNGGLGTIAYTPTQKFNTVETLYRRSTGLGTFTMDFGGVVPAGGATATAGSDAFLKKTLSSGSAAALQTLGIVDTSGFVVVGQQTLVYDSAVPAIDYGPAGYSGTQMSDKTGSSLTYSYLPNMKVWAPHLVFQNSCINDMNSVTGVDVTTFKANYRVWLDYLITNPSGVLANVILETPHQVSAGYLAQNIQDTFAQAIRDLAVEYGVPCFDHYAKWGPYSASRMADNIHPLASFLDQKAAWKATAIKALWDAS